MGDQVRRPLASTTPVSGKRAVPRTTSSPWTSRCSADRRHLRAADEGESLVAAGNQERRHDLPCPAVLAPHGRNAGECNVAIDEDERHARLAAMLNQLLRRRSRRHDEGVDLIAEE